MEIKTLQDYYGKVKERFPDLEQWEIEKILNHGMRSFFMVNAYGADVLLKCKNFTMYFGKLFSSKLTFYKYSLLKYRIKYRIRWKRDKRVWDGFYYVGFSEDEYKKYFSGKKGRLKNKITFDKIYGFKIPEECYINKGHKYFFKLGGEEDCGFSLYKENYTTRNLTYLGKRDKNGNINFV